MDLDGFLQGLARLRADDITALAAAIEHHHETVADEVEAWEVMMCIDDALRRHGRSRAAARAAHDAVQAVRRAAESCAGSDGVVLAQTVVTRVAREAALFARALVAGEDARGAVRQLLVEWERLPTAAA